MKPISSILIHEQPDSGVYWVGSEILQSELTSMSNIEFCRLCHIRGEKIHTLQELLDEAQLAMNSPEHCNYSLDTLLDCMRGIEHPSSLITLCVFLYKSIDVFAKSSPADFQDLLNVFKYATTAWRERAPKKRMYVLLVGDRSFADSIPNLQL